ncbi:MAG: hypothetical protein V5A55_06910 [Halovenus sp.]
MSRQNTTVWESLEEWTPRLFLLAGVILIVASANYAITVLLDSVTFNSWVGLTVVIGRWVSLLGVAGLSVGIVKRSPRAGRLSRVVVSLAVLFTTGLLVTAILSNAGVTTPLSAIFGLGTILLSIVTYAMFGIGILRTDAYSTLIGALLLVMTIGLLWGFIGQIALAEGPGTMLGIIGTTAEAILFATNLAIGYRLGTELESRDRAEPASDAAPE